MDNRRLTKRGFLTLVVLIVFFACGPVFGYTGPGAGLTAIGAFLAIVVGLLLAILGFLWYPIKRLVRGLRNRSGDNSEQDGS